MEHDIFSLSSDMNSLENELQGKLDMTIEQLIIRYNQYCDDYFFSFGMYKFNNTTNAQEKDSVKENYWQINSLFNFCYQIVYQHEQSTGFFAPINLRSNSLTLPSIPKQSRAPITLDSTIYTPSELHLYLLQHVILCNYYSMLEHESKVDKLKFLLNDEYTNYKKRVVSVTESFPQNTINHLFSKGDGISHKDFLADFDTTLLNVHAEFSTKRVFLNHSPYLVYNKPKEINQRIKEIVESLVNYYYDLYEPITSSKNSLPLAQATLYVYKLESLFGVTFFNDFIRKVTFDKNFTLSNQNSIADIYKIFNQVQSVFARKTIFEHYLDGDYSLEDIKYITKTLIPLITNTFFCLIKRIFPDDAISKLESYIAYCLTEPAPQDLYTKDPDQIHPYYKWNNVSVLLSHDFSSSFAFDSPINSTALPDLTAHGTSLKETLTLFFSKYNDNDKLSFFESVIERYRKDSWIIPSSKL